MKATVEYWNPENKTVVTETGYRYYSKKPIVTDTEVWNGTKEEIFKRYDKENNRLRYCNGSYYTFTEKKLIDEYMDWYNSLSENTRFNMYYCNGVVD